MNSPGGRSIRPSPNKRDLALWIVFHAALGVLLGISLFFAPLRINMNLLDVLPSDRSAGGGGIPIGRADRVISERSSRQIIILADNPDFESARKAGEEMYAALGSSPFFENATFRVDAEMVSGFSDFLHDYRYALLDRKTESLLESGGAGLIANDALASAYGLFTLASLDNLEQDPFLLTERETRSFLSSLLSSSPAMSLSDGVLCAEYEGSWFVMIRAVLTNEGAFFLRKENAVTFIYSQAERIFPDYPGTRFHFSGVPFHTYESSSGARKEAALISGVSLLLVVLILAMVFRSVVPVALSAGAVLLSIGTAFAGCFLFFREIHILTLVFGTSLIGTCVDYSIHYFTHRYRTGAGGRAVRDRIKRGVTMGFLSTEICFFILIFAPFAILKQFALFSVFGMLSSYLTVMCLYPALSPGDAMARHSRVKPVPLFFGKINGAFTRIRPALIAALVLVSVPVVFFNREKLVVRNDIAGLYTASPFLLENEKTVSRVLDYGSAPWYYIVTGASEQEVLEREEALLALLSEEIVQNNMDSALAASNFVPSIKRQQKNYSAASELIPLAASQLESLGFPGGAERVFIEDFDARKGLYLLPSSEMPAYFRELLSQLWIGNLDGSYYSAVLLVNPVPDSGRFAKIAQALDSVYLVNKVASINRNLDSLTRTVLMLYGIACLAIAVIVRLFYPWRDTIRICSLPLILILVTSSVLILEDIPLGFFPVCAFVLVFGLGLDYSFYCLENRKQKHKEAGLTAIFLSFLTTVLSFGALVLSSFMPIHVFGLVVCTGLTAALLSAFLLRGKKE
ncbi:MAG: MMPL family transporter [Treponema sp.]|nr:MMPL family transporter [Treponema sp.]